MTIFNHGMVTREGRRQAEREFFHQKSLQQLSDKIKELFDFRRLNIKSHAKLHKLIRFLASYDSKILKDIRNNIKFFKHKRSSMVFLPSTYKRKVISCFLPLTLFAIFPIIFPSLLHFLCVLPLPLLFGLTTHASTPEDNSNGRDQKGSPTSDNNNSEKPDRTQKKKSTSTAEYIKQLFPDIKEIIEVPGATGPAVAIYVRVSSWSQFYEGKSLDYQRQELLELAEKINASVIYVISDEAKSGRNFRNRKLGTILQLASAGLIKRLLVSEVDRAGRDAFELLYYLFKLRRYGAIIQTPKEELDLTKLVDLVNLAFKSAAAEDQVLLRGAGSKRTKVGNFLKGQWNLPIPLGQT